MVNEAKAARVDRQMLRRDPPPDQYRSDRPLRAIRIQMDEIEAMRDLPPQTALASSLGFLAEALEELTWHDLARLAYLEQLAVYRELDAAQPGAFAEHLRRALTSLRRNLVQLGHYEEAVPVVHEERRLSLRLADTDATAPHTARSWLTTILVKLDRHDEAVESAAAAVSEARGLPATPEDRPKDFSLAYALAGYAERLARVGRAEESLEAAVEAVEIWRRHAADQPIRYAKALDLLGHRLARVGRYEPARTAFAEVVHVLRMQVEIDKYHRDALAAALSNFGNQLDSLGSHREALIASEEAVARHRELAEQERVRAQRMESSFTEDDDLDYVDLAQQRKEREAESRARIRDAELTLGVVLVNLGTRLHNLGRLDEALAVNAEAIAIVRGHVDANPTAGEPKLAMALNNRSILLDDMARHEESLAAAREAVELNLRLVAADPGAHEPNLATARNTMCMSLSNLGRHDEALVASLESLAAYRRMHESDPWRFAGLLADALTDHGLVRSRRGEHAEAIAATIESVRQYRQLAEHDPGRYSAGCAYALVVFAEVRLAADELPADGLAAAQEAVARFEHLAVTLPEAYQKRLAQAQSILNRLGQPEL